MIEVFIHGAGKFIGCVAMAAILAYCFMLLGDWRDKYYATASPSITPAIEPARIPWTSNCCGHECSVPEYGICPDCKDHCSFERYDDDGNAIETY